MKTQDLLPSLALATALITPISHAGEFTIGAGAYSSKSEYINLKDTSGAMPFIEYEGEGWSAGTDGISVGLYGDEESALSVAVILTSAGDGFEAKDSDAFKGLKDRDSSVDLGLAVEYQIGEGAITTTLLGDVSSTHKGYVVDVSYSHELEILGGYLQPGIGVEFLSSDYTDYYYGVRANEATANRKAYSASGTTNAYVNYNFLYPINDNFKLMHGTTFTQLGDEIKDSSIVDKSNTWSTYLGIGYTF